MTRHSKNATARSFFTFKEKERLGYGTQRERLTRESHQKIHFCAICLSVAIDAVVCAEGHCFCRECALGSIMSQISAYKRELNAWGHACQQERDKEKMAQEKSKKREYSSFVELQNPLSTLRNASNSDNFHNSNAADAKKDVTTICAKQRHMPRKPKKSIKCPMTGHSPFTSASLRSIKWTLTADDPNKDPKPTCPTCNKNLTVGVSVRARVCGHVYCALCIQKFKGDLCAVCGCKDGDDESEYIEIASMGTGYASTDGDAVIASKYEPAFN